jgi:streptogramin lyase
LSRPSWLEKLVLGSPSGRSLSRAYSAAMSNGVLYVCDTRAGSLITFDLELGQMGVEPKEDRRNLVRPQNIKIVPSGDKYVVDTEKHRIIVLDAENRVVRSFSSPDEYHPTDVAVFQDSLLYVADMLDREIQILSLPTGETLGAIGGPGGGEGSFAAPTHVAVDFAGNVYVSDLMLCSVQVFSPNGEFLRRFGRCGRLPGDLARPKGVAVDRNGITYVVDAAFENVQLFNSEGETLLFFGGPGSHPGSLWLPAGISLDYDPRDIGYFEKYVAPDQEIEYLIFVTSQVGPSHVNVYAFLRQDES